MKKTTYILLTLVSLLFIANQSDAQTNPGQSNPEDYQFAAGLKFGGFENGISLKYFMNTNTALEGIIGFRQNGVVFTGLYELHQQIFDLKELRFYYGFGAHIGSTGVGTYKRFGGNDEVYKSAQLLLGADGVIGLEYAIPRSPIAVSLDLNPRIELATGPFVDLAPGLGIKYAF